MIARIISKNETDRTVMLFCDYPEIDSRDVEDTWYEAIKSTCPQDGGACGVGSGSIVSMLPMSKELRSRIGAGDGPSGLVVGIRVSDRMWQRIESGDIKTFNITFDPCDGVRVIPQRERETATKKIRKENYMSDLISKCQSAVQKGDLSDLTRECFAKALEQLATKYAVDNQDLTHEQAYNLAIKSEVGRDLYAGYDRAPSSGSVQKASTFEKSESESDPGEANAWEALQQAAKTFRKETGNRVTIEQAMAAVMKDEPQLYENYEILRQKRQVSETGRDLAQDFGSSI